MILSRSIVRIWILTVLAGLALSLAPAGTIQKDRPLAPALTGMGDLHMPVTTRSEKAQRFFDQGVVLAYGFNFAEAERSFREAARLDPECAMAYWGIALALGPNYNAPMADEALPPVREALDHARRLASKSTAFEQAMIQALVARYPAEPVADRTALDAAYAAAMADVARRFPNQPEAVVRYAEALMNQHPWDLWEADGQPKPWTPRILATLEGALQQWPDHPGANHYYIHAVEASTRPERGLTAAERLGDLVPGAGHLVHMPAHIYIRTGRYHAASEANERAIAADRGYITQCRQQGIYPLMYHPHNWHFLAVTATLEGRQQRAVQAARQMAKIVRGHMRGEYTTLQHFFSVQYFVLTKFGMWDAILQETPPPAELAYPTGVWRFARGMALTRLDRLDEAGQELAALKKIAADESLREVTIWGTNNYYDLLGIAVNVLGGELAAAKQDYDRAEKHLRTAMAAEEKLIYDEPASWFPPVRQNLAAVLLQAGRAAAAEDVCRADLRRYPDNGWTLFTLARCLEAQGKTAAAEQARADFQRAWQHADVKAVTILP